MRAGEARGLMGENGAGKSTLLKILGGEYRPRRGRGRDRRRPPQLRLAARQPAAGIAIIHQELQLAPDLSVAENMLLGAYPTRLGLLDRKAMRDTAAAMLARLGETIDPDTRVGALSIGKRQMVEIGKALLRDARIIAFDEPTSCRWSARETETLKRIIAELRADGRAILYVSHRMEEVFEICDSITVLRDGRHVADFPDMATLTQDMLIQAMAGRTIADIYDYRAREHGPISVAIEGVTGPGVREPVSFDVRSGEILGLFGLAGAGRSELMKLLYGAEPLASGSIRFDGVPFRARDPRAAIAAGLALCPEDRKAEGSSRSPRSPRISPRAPQPAQPQRTVRRSRRRGTAG